jgi:hypothetical protein
MLDQNDPNLQLMQAIASLRCDINLHEQEYDSSAQGNSFSTGPDDKRRFKRLKFNFDLALQYQQSFPSLQRPTGWSRIRSIDISRNGLGFYHSEQMFPHETAKIMLQDGNTHQIEVARCKRIRENCFEIGAKIMEPDTVHDSASPR